MGEKQTTEDTESSETPARIELELNNVNSIILGLEKELADLLSSRKLLGNSDSGANDMETLRTNQRIANIQENLTLDYGKQAFLMAKYDALPEDQKQDLHLNSEKNLPN